MWVNLDYNIEFANYIIKPTIIHPGMCHLIYTIVYDVIIHSIINSYTIIVYDVIINSIINSYTIVYNFISHTHTYIYYNNSYLDTYFLYLPLVIGRSFFLFKNVQLFQTNRSGNPTLNISEPSELSSYISYIIHVWVLYAPIMVSYSAWPTTASRGQCWLFSMHLHASCFVCVCVCFY